jgi:hypothetical protein
MVAAAILLYTLWASGSPLPGMGGTRATGAVILVLGFIASATAVVPSFTQLLHGNKAYLAITSMIGAVAAVAGLQMLITASRTGLAVVMAAMVLLWMIATTHHTMLDHTMLERVRGGNKPPAATGEHTRSTPHRHWPAGVR